MHMIGTKCRYCFESITMGLDALSNVLALFHETPNKRVKQHHKVTYDMQSLHQKQKELVQSY